jgi:hypothetical protein
MTMSPNSISSFAYKISETEVWGKDILIFQHQFAQLGQESILWLFAAKLSLHY